ncbi:cilia- and flagella-associated protein 119-like isoform X2 [Amphiura filiformis]
MAANGPEEIKRILSDLFKLTDYHDNLASAILLDLYFYTVQFALDHNFDKEQLSAFFSIVKKTHEVCSETPFGNVEQCYEYFKELVLCHAVKRPPWSVNQFSPHQVKLITDYVLNTYFRHMKLYKYVFTPMVRLDLSMSYLGMPPTPPPSQVAEDEKPDELLEETEQADMEQEGGEEEKTEEEPPQDEESPAHQELRQLITSQLNGEIEKLRSSLNEQIHLNDEALQQKLTLVDGGASGGKSSRNSSKSRKK